MDTNFKNEYDFTVFTSIFNRKNTINRVWDSLNNQTSKNFEWIVIEDGSVDGVEALLESYKLEAKFPMRVIYQENQGKHRSWNTAAMLAKGKFFLPADSDDSFIPETMEKLLSFWNRIPISERINFSGVNVHCFDSKTKSIIGNLYPKDNFISNNLELDHRYRITGEKWGMIRSDLMRKYQFPNVISRSGFFPEDYLWYTLAKEGYKVLCVNEPLRYYFQDTTNSVLKTARKNPNDAALSKYLFTSWHINNNLKYLLSLLRFKEIIKNYLQLYRNGMLINKNHSSIFNDIDGYRQRLLYIFFLPITYLFYIITYKKYKIK
jgi:glycosyltransferase involved in cell wall biosynthesis